eukprot:m.280570 g.280570  ORF g.280570 m.280570 type:complete len:80 (+) comp54919_c1_seq12:368-607(+)
MIPPGSGDRSVCFWFPGGWMQHIKLDVRQDASAQGNSCILVSVSVLVCLVACLGLVVRIFIRAFLHEFVCLASFRYRIK